MQIPFTYKAASTIYTYGNTLISSLLPHFGKVVRNTDVKCTKSLILTFSILLLENASKAEENASDVAHSGLLFAVTDGVMPGVVAPKGSPSDIEPFI